MKKFKAFVNENKNSIADTLKSYSSIEELEEKIAKYSLNKGDLMNIAYDNDVRDVDVAIPSGLWDKMKEHGGKYWFVMDYTDNKVGGKIVHLGEKIIGKETNWEEVFND
jgi:hypothetical protein